MCKASRSSPGTPSVGDPAAIGQPVEPGPRILVVEDEPFVSAAIATLLTDEGYRVTTAANGALALDEMRQSRPDLLLLDLMLPIVGGEQVRRIMVEDRALAAIPVVLMSAIHFQSRAAELGCAGFIAKPFELQTLLEAVARALAPRHDSA